MNQENQDSFRKKTLDEIALEEKRQEMMIG